MKTTMMFRSIANPRRTTLASLTDDESAQLPAEPEAAEEPEAAPKPLPARTANPRRTTLMEAPAGK